MQKLVSSRPRPRDRDVEAAVTDATGTGAGNLLDPADLERKPSHCKDANSDVDDDENYHTAADTDQRLSTQNTFAALAITSDSNPRLLSDEENDRMNRKIDRLIAAINDGRSIHFAPDAETGEVEIFADHQDEVVDQDEHELERSISASPENFGRIIRARNGIHRIRSLNSQRYANSSESWTSTDATKSSSNAWERAVAAANIRFALEHGDLDQDATASLEIDSETPPSRRQFRMVSPIPLDFYKQIRASTPSIHSNGTEMDTSSPLFRTSCKRILRDAYAEPPESTFQREFQEHSQLDEWAFVSEPRDAPSPEASESEAPSSKGKAFGVFEDASNGALSSKEVDKPAIRSKALKDISNLRRPGYLQFNSFAKDTISGDNRTGTAAPATSSSIGLGGAHDPESRRVFIQSKWPGLLEDPGKGSMAEPPSLDGTARRRNEQTIGRPIDRSHYSLSHVKTSVTESSLDQYPIRQAHFDLALARLEGRALPPPSSPILRHPDSATLFDRDIQTEGSHRPLPIRGPTPSRPANPTPHRAFWQYLV